VVGVTGVVTVGPRIGPGNLTRTPWSNIGNGAAMQATVLHDPG